MAGEEILFGNPTMDASLTSGLTAGIIMFIAVWMAAIYVYFALAFQSIAKKSGYKRPWFAWIPLLNVVMILELGGFNWAWIFLYSGTLINSLKLFTGTASVVVSVLSVIATIALAVISIISVWRIFEKAGYNGALALLMLVPIGRMIVAGIVAWEKKSYKKTVSKTAVKKKAVRTTPIKKKVTKSKPTKKVVAKKKK